MINNFLSEALDSFFQEISYFNGNLYIINSLIESRSAQIQSDFPVPQSLWNTGTFFRDVILHPDVDNLFPTGYGYDVGTRTLNQQAERSISFICCNTIATVYESFDTFLKDILAQLSINTEHQIAFKLKDNYQTLADVLANLWLVRSDKGFLKIIRRIAPTFPQFEKKNIYNFNLGNWYNLIDLTRHQIIHNRQQATKNFISELKKKGYWKLFNQNFSMSAGKSPLIMVSYGQAAQILSHFSEYAYLIFKSLSRELGLQFETTLSTYKPIQNIF